MAKRHITQAVTRVACRCDWLLREASEPVSPVQFDEEMGEYHVRHTDGGFSILRHCPWCGGVAPKSKRASQFETVPTAEWQRLATLTSTVKSVEEALTRFGKPDREDPGGLELEHSRKASKADRARSFRTLVFSKLSSVAEVGLDDYGPAGICFSFTAKALRRRPRRRR